MACIVLAVPQKNISEDIAREGFRSEQLNRDTDMKHALTVTLSAALALGAFARDVNITLCTWRLGG